MAESTQHRRYVKYIYDYIKEHFCNDDDRLIRTDLFEKFERPDKIGNYIPDIQYESFVTGAKVIGEAKSEEDVCKQRSVKQITAFLEYCHLNKAIFILAVPWDEFARATNLIRSICNKCGYIVNFIVLKFLPKE